MVKIKLISLVFGFVFSFLLCNVSGANEYNGILIRLKQDRSNFSLSNFKNFGITVKEKLITSDKRTYLVEVPKEKSVKNAINILKSIDVIEIAEPNYIITINQEEENTPNDPLFGQLWGLNNTGNNLPKEGDLLGVPGADIDALKAWNITKGDRRIKIAIIDTGIDYTHPDLNRNIWVNESELNGTEGVDDDGNGYIDDIHGFNFVTDLGNPLDDHGHGTHCSGTIGAVHNNNLGVLARIACRA